MSLEKVILLFSLGPSKFQRFEQQIEHTNSKDKKVLLIFSYSFQVRTIICTNKLTLYDFKLYQSNYAYA
jgi:hypothetical protein